MASAGQGLAGTGPSPWAASLTFRWWTDYNGQETVVLNSNQIPGHYHTVPGHNHYIPQYVNNMATPNSNQAFVSNASGARLQITAGYTDSYPGGVTGWAGADQAHENVGPRFYCFFLIKL